MKFKHYVRDSGRIYGTDSLAFWKDAEKLTRAEGERLYRAQAVADLREFLKPGDTIYTCLRHVSASGMQRRISLHVAKVESRTDRNGKARRVPIIRDISFMAANAMQERKHDDGGIIVNGCGMDMGFHLVYSLSRTLFPDGTKAQKDGTKARKDGGYSLNQQWL